MCGTINELNDILLISRGNICFNLFKIPIVLEHVFDIFSVCFFQFKFVSITKPKKIDNLFNISTVYLQVEYLYIFLLKYHVFRFYYI